MVPAAVRLHATTTTANHRGTLDFDRPCLGNMEAF
jgi:hypothetical protein